MIVPSVVVRTDLLIILGFRVGQNVSCEREENEFEELPGKTKVCPVVPVFHDVETISVKVHRTIEVHFTKGLERDAVSALPFRAVCRVLERDILLYRPARQLDLVVRARATSG